MTQIIRRIAALAVVAMLVVACGSSSPSSSNTTPSSGDPAQAAFKFARCMRNHGRLEFSRSRHLATGRRYYGHDQAPRRPVLDPRASDGTPGVPRHPVNPEQTAAANRAREPDLLVCARCMRRHSVADFRDPTSQGQLTLEMPASASVDVRAPNVLSAAKTCLPVSTGAITPANVQRAVTGHN
jgi:hypothetical protein